MNNKDQRDTVEAAADWCDRLAHLSDAERQELKLWLAGPDHARAFDRVRRTILDVALLEAAGDLASVPKARARLREWFTAIFAAKASWGVLVGAAATICAVMVLRPQPSVPQSGPAQLQILATVTGQRSEATLADKSIVYLNADTQVAITYSNRVRHLNLARGAAIFQVTKDKARPFQVATATVTVTAVGTRFGVDRIGDAVEVRVFEGTVKVAGKSVEDRAVTRGQWLVVDPRRGVSRGMFSPDNDPDWRTGWLNADRMPLPYIVARLNRYTANKIEIADRSLVDVSLSGRFRLATTNDTLKQISAALNIEAELHNHEILLRRRHE